MVSSVARTWCIVDTHAKVSSPKAHADFPHLFLFGENGAHQPRSHGVELKVAARLLLYDVVMFMEE